MSSLFHRPGKWHQRSASSSRHPEEKSRKRLQKRSRTGRSVTGPYCRRDEIDVVLIGSCSTLVPVNIDLVPVDAERKTIPNQVPCLKAELPASSGSLSPSYSSNENEEIPSPKRRAKTPVYFVGQLERKSNGDGIPDLARTLSEQYCALLPERHWTPAPEEIIEEINRQRPLRKMKPWNNLRSHIEDHTNPSFYSDCETLVGSATSSEKGAHSDNEEGFLSPRNRGGRTEKFEIFKEERLSDDDDDAFVDANSVADDDTGLQDCLHLLAKELQLYEAERSASRRQVRVIIEAFESAQQFIHHEDGGDGVRSLKGVLDPWVEALRSVYELSSAEENRTARVHESNRWDKGRWNSSNTRARVLV